MLTILPIHPEAEKRVTTPSQNTSVENQTHPYTGVFPIETLPKELQVLVNSLNIRSSKKELRLIIQKLCGWQPLSSAISRIFEKKR